MNATLQCFFNVPSLTKYFLTKAVYTDITQNSNKYELSSSYCDLLFHVCCDDKVVNYYEPNDFKNTISRKNPLFKGVNANDSKDLVNFMLETMNQELIQLNQKSNDDNQRNNLQIDQTNKYSMLNIFKSEFSKNNKSIIAKNFFFITETETICSSCNIKKYNYQVLYLLEFPLELVFNFCVSNNYKYMDNNGKKYIQLYKCFEQYNLPNKFTGENQLYCNGCNKLTDALCTSRIYSLPKTLVIILNRGKGKVFDCVVDFPSELDLSKYILCPQSIAKYKLSGVITHLGESGMSGHFIAFCRHRLNDTWYRYNDSIVTS
jgi:ubiquitin C-terminal hydrolase